MLLLGTPHFVPSCALQEGYVRDDQIDSIFVRSLVYAHLFSS